MLLLKLQKVNTSKTSCSVYQYFKNSAVREKILKNYGIFIKGKITENKDQCWLSSDAESKRIWELFSEIIFKFRKLS